MQNDQNTNPTPTGDASMGGTIPAAVNTTVPGQPPVSGASVADPNMGTPMAVPMDAPVVDSMATQTVDTTVTGAPTSETPAPTAVDAPAATVLGEVKPEEVQTM